MLRNTNTQTYGCRGQEDKIGILVGQLGTPDAPTAAALRPYLRQFLSDPRVIEKPKLLWQFILNAFILPVRPKKSAALYKRIWTEEGSPLLLTSYEFAEKIKEALSKEVPELEVEVGMRYGTPSFESAIDKLAEAGCTKILLFNMYAQYSGSTSASNYDAVFAHLLKRRLVPTLRVAEPYFDHPEHVQSLAHIINESLAKLDKEPERLVLSYHGVPEEYVAKGDPYCCHCVETTQALYEHINYPKEKIIHTYQSRFGKDPWLTPYTDETIEALGHEGVKHIAVACPGFTMDCLETLDEMGNEAFEEFEEAGGERLDLIPCLNAHPRWIEGASSIIKAEISSWIETATRNSARKCKVSCPVEALVEKGFSKRA